MVFDLDLTPHVRCGTVHQLTLVVDSPQDWSGPAQRMFLWSPQGN
jgi:hypothetical protein